MPVNRLPNDGLKGNDIYKARGNVMHGRRWGAAGLSIACVYWWFCRSSIPSFTLHLHDRITYNPNPYNPPCQPPATRHKQDIEGLSNSLAIAAKKGIDRHLLKSISDDDPVWDGVAHALGALFCVYILVWLAPIRIDRSIEWETTATTHPSIYPSIPLNTGSLCATLVLMCSVERIVISGGVLNRKILYPKIRVRVCFCCVWLIIQSHRICQCMQYVYVDACVCVRVSRVSHLIDNESPNHARQRTNPLINQPNPTTGQDAGDFEGLHRPRAPDPRQG